MNKSKTIEAMKRVSSIPGCYFFLSKTNQEKQEIAIKITGNAADTISLW